jgi:anti-sigma B factor antagonist
MREQVQFELLFEESVNPGRYAVVRARGEIDLSNADELEATIVQGWEETHAPVVVDLSQVEFMGSNGLSALIVALNRLCDEGSELRLRRPSATVRRILEVTGLVGTFKTED